MTMTQRPSHSQSGVSGDDNNSGQYNTAEGLVTTQCACKPRHRAPESHGRASPLPPSVLLDKAYPLSVSWRNGANDMR